MINFGIHQEKVNQYHKFLLTRMNTKFLYIYIYKNSFIITDISSIQVIYKIKICFYFLLATDMWVNYRNSEHLNTDNVIDGPR